MRTVDDSTDLPAHRHRRSGSSAPTSGGSIRFRFDFETIRRSRGPASRVQRPASSVQRSHGPAQSISTSRTFRTRSTSRPRLMPPATCDRGRHRATNASLTEAPAGLRLCRGTDWGTGWSWPGRVSEPAGLRVCRGTDQGRHGRVGEPAGLRLGRRAYPPRPGRVGKPAGHTYGLSRELC